jgi:murein DD-endopeptidase MepM/ murein hydrolase activator NlpD
MTKALSLSPWLKLTLLLFFGVWCLFVTPSVLAQSVWVPPVAQATGSLSDLRQQQQQLEQQRSNLNQEQTRLQNLERAAQNRLGGLQDSIQTTAAQIAQNEAQLKVASEQLQQLQAELAQAEQSYQARQFATVARLRFLQRQQGSQGWAVLLQSQDLNEFLDRRRQLKLVYQADRQILTQLKAQADDLNQRRGVVEQQKNQIALLTAQLQAQKAEYQAQASTQQALVDRLQQDRRALEAAEAQLQRDSADIATLIRQRLAIANQRGRIQGTGQLSYPSDGVITSSFGMRVHPILGYRRFHAGIDFGAAHGSTIRAANTGTVIFAGWYGGYGKAVIIDHGGSLTTLYGHSSQVFVSEGQTVQRGQPIAAVGSTGFSTGPHLHFEVRQNGEPVNPANFL